MHQVPLSVILATPKELLSGTDINTAPVTPFISGVLAPICSRKPSPPVYLNRMATLLVSSCLMELSSEPTSTPSCRTSLAERVTVFFRACTDPERQPCQLPCWLPEPLQQYDSHTAAVPGLPTGRDRSRNASHPYAAVNFSLSLCER